MAKRSIRLLNVLRKERLSPNLQRVVLTGASLADFPEGQQGCYVKLLLPKAGSFDYETLEDPNELDLGGFFKRSYTVVEADTQTLVLDFVDHEDGGPAGRWVDACGPGEPVLVAGPGPVKMLNQHAEWFLLAGDFPALPAITANLARLPQGARGYAVIEVPSLEDRRELPVPEGIRIAWLEHKPSSSAQSPLANHVRQLTWLPGRASVWVAAEYSTMKSLRQYLIKERAVAAEDTYVSSYWKLGATDEQHKAAKKAGA